MPVTIGQAMRNARFRSGKTLEQMARHAHVSKSALCNFETGRRRVHPDVVMSYWDVTFDPELRDVAIAAALLELVELYEAFGPAPHAPGSLKASP